MVDPVLPCHADLVDCCAGRTKNPPQKRRTMAMALLRAALAVNGSVFTLESVIATLDCVLGTAIKGANP